MERIWSFFLRTLVANCGVRSTLSYVLIRFRPIIINQQFSNRSALLTETNPLNNGIYLLISVSKNRMSRFHQAYTKP